VDFTRIGDFTCRASESEELVGVTQRKWWDWYRFTQKISSIGECNKNRVRYNN